MAEGIYVVEEYADVPTSKQAGRSSFGEMVDYLRQHAEARIILVEKVDCLYRNLQDWVTLDELDMEIHCAKENVVLTAESRSSEKFMPSIKALMSKNYIDNLSEETRKGMIEKAEQVIHPSRQMDLNKCDFGCDEELWDSNDLQFKICGTRDQRKNTD